MQLFQKFQQATGLSWPGWSIVLIQAITLLSMLTLTVLDLLPILKQYTDKNVAVEIAIIKNETGQQPNVTVCLPYYSASLANIASWVLKIRDNESSYGFKDEEAMKNHSWDIWNKTMDMDIISNKDGVQMATASYLIAQVLEDTGENFDILRLNRTNYNWNQPIVDAVWHFFTCITKQDTYFLTLDGSTGCDFNITDLDWGPNKVLDQLWTRILEAAAVYYDFYVYHNQSMRYLHSLTARPAVTVFGEYFCFPFLAQAATDQLLSLSAFKSVQDPPWKRFNRSRSLAIFPDESVLYSTVSGRFSALYLTNAANVESINDESVYISYAASTRVVEGRQDFKKLCSPEPNAAKCLIKRQVDEAIEKCGCLPFSFRYFRSDQENLRYCNKTMYSQCQGELWEKLKRKTEDCDNRCEYTIYKWQTNFVAGEIPNQRNLRYYITVKPLSTIFIQFTTVVRDTPEKLASQIGGLVNLYLGFSGMSACALVVYCIKSVKKWRSLKSDSSKSTGNGWSSGAGGDFGLRSTRSEGRSSNKQEMMKEMQEQMARLQRKMTLLEQDNFEIRKMLARMHK